MDAPYVQDVFFKNDANYGGFFGPKNDIFTADTFAE